MAGLIYSFKDMTAYVQRYMEHPLLIENDLHQSISQFHYDVTHAILRSAGIPSTEAKETIAAVLLLHQGLSIHDTVDSESDVRRQLVVLAGDYDSSLYYYVLARLNNNVLLSKLCDAVVVINEAKMALFHPESEISDEEYWTLHESVQGELIRAVASHYLSTPEQQPIHQLLESLIRTYVVYDRLAGRSSETEFSIQTALARINQTASSIIANYKGDPKNEFLAFANQLIHPFIDAVQEAAHVEGIG